MATDMTDTATFDRADVPTDVEPEDEVAPVERVPATGWRVDPVPVLERAWEKVKATKPQTWVTFAVVTGCVLFVFRSVHPELIFRNTTPTGGDMGAHVWGPNYLMHHLLPHGRISGWSPDWYAGFPAFQYYMVVPALVVVALDVGVRSPLILPALLLALGVLVSGWFVPNLFKWRRLLFGVGILLTILTVPVPYNIAFKLVTISGLLALPICCWAFGKLTDLPFPGPPILALGALFMIYNREPTVNNQGTGNIIGGNMASTMAGEFAFMISISLAVLYLGFLINGMRTGKHRRTAAVLLALTGLCHLIPVFFALTATVVALAVWPGKARLKWAAPVLPVAGLLSAFWVAPFLLGHKFVNDMGWERLPGKGATNADGSLQTVWNYLIPHALWWPLALAAVGLVVSIVYQYRSGILLASTAVIFGAAFCWVPQARLWNARLLPFFYLSVFLLAAVGVAEVVRSIGTLVARDPERPGPLANSLGTAACAVFVLLFVGIPLGILPGTTNPPKGGVTWLAFHRSYRNDIPGWAQWNYTGLEGKPAQVGDGGTVPDGQGGWPEFHAMVQTMTKIGQDPAHGCGRAFWEYSDRLNTYGTPMAPMMLPYFTNSCIGSMEGLYFESSATTPYHFITQCALSAKGSCAQRDLDYPHFDQGSFGLGIQEIEQLGVKYYMATTPEAIAAANADKTLSLVDISGPWHIYQLPDAKSALVTGLTNQPVVMSNIDDGQSQWLDPSLAWFLDPSKWDVMMADGGPKEWARITIPDVPIDKPDGTKRATGDRTLPVLPKRAVTPATASNVKTADNRISFDVDRVGSPMLVKTSYFPNWKVDGAKGPYRVAPNLMVVIPTAKHVSLHYGRTTTDYLAILLTLIGIAGLIFLTKLAPVVMPQPKPRPVRRRPEPEAGAGVPPGAPYLGGPYPPGAYPQAPYPPGHGAGAPGGHDFADFMRTVSPSAEYDAPVPWGLGGPPPSTPVGDAPAVDQPRLFDQHEVEPEPVRPEPAASDEAGRVADPEE